MAGAEADGAWPPDVDPSSSPPPRHSPLMECVREGDAERAYACLTSGLYALQVAWASVRRRVDAMDETWRLPGAVADHLREASEWHAELMTALQHAAASTAREAEQGAAGSEMVPERGDEGWEARGQPMALAAVAKMTDIMEALERASTVLEETHA